jgi:hypothetical protein
MDKPLEHLLVQFLTWVATAPRTHADAMEAWATRCPRLPAWEEAVDAGLIACAGVGDAPVRLTSRGAAWLAAHGQGRCAPAAAAV